MSGTWSIDIETIGDPTRSIQTLRMQGFKKIAETIERDLTLPRGQRVILNNTLVDRVKLEADAGKKLQEAQQVTKSGDSLNPLTATPICVVCIPMLENISMESKSLHQVFIDMGKFYTWAQQEAGQFLGFNIDAFDIPCLRLHQARTASGIVPRIPAFWNHSIDLRREFGDIYNKGEVYSTPRSLLYYVATILDQEAQHPGPVKEYLESTFTGADVAAAYVDNDMDKIIRHCVLDALMVALIAVKMGIYR